MAEFRPTWGELLHALIDAVPDGPVDDSFYSKIAGATHCNADGSSRLAVLRRCVETQFFDLVPEPENPVDPKAVAVYTLDGGEQVGYLPERTAHDLLKRMDEPGGKWYATLSEFNLHPETERIVGANIAVFHVCFEKMRRQPIAVGRMIELGYL